MKREDIPADVVDSFRQILELRPSDAIPEEVEEVYCFYRHAKDICGQGQIGPSELIMLAAIASKKKQQKEEAEPFKSGEKVETLWNDKPAKGVVVSDSGGDVIRVKISGDKMNYREVLREATKRTDSV